MTDTILEMLENADSCDEEVSIRIFAYLERYDFGDCKYTGAKNVALYNNGQIVPGCGISEYTTSLDAAMSIGAEELEGWELIYLGIRGTWKCMFRDTNGQQIKTAHNQLEAARAICHARCQALEYVRSQNGK